MDLAQRACTVSGFRDPTLMTTLAAAYAETGRFAEAVITANRARDLVTPADGPQARKIHEQLEHYEQRRPYRDWQ